MATGENGSGVVILVVEDEELARLIIADYLKEAGFTVLESCRGRVGVTRRPQRRSCGGA